MTREPRCRAPAPRFLVWLRWLSTESHQRSRQCLGGFAARCPRDDRSRRRRSRGPADEPGGRRDRGLGPGGQRRRALSRLVPQQGDVGAADDGGLVARGQCAWQCRQAAGGASRARRRLCHAALTGLVGTGFPHLQHPQEAGRLLLAEPVLFGADRRAGGADPCRAAWDFWRSACATPRRASPRPSAAFRPGGWWPPRPAWVFSGRWRRPGCCISAAPIMIPSCICR